VPVVLLLSDQHKGMAKDAEVGKHRCVLQMPVKSRELRQAILKVLDHSV
jgi:hypothetical protein